ncbi:MAG: MogA/MoaB family molybdenum cofactor biosynthesis protein, partial [Thermomicrobiales bacterium]
MSDMPFSLDPQRQPAANSASTEQHREEAPASVAVAVLTISDTRTPDDDRSGQLIKQQLTWRGHDLREYAIVKDDATEIEAILHAWIGREDIRAIVTNGGTGIARRDTTYEV